MYQVPPSVYVQTPHNYVPVVVSPYVIINKVAQETKVSYEQMKGKTRKAKILLARQICLTLIDRYCGLSQRESIRLFPGFERTNVSTSKQVIQDYMCYDNPVRELMLQIWPGWVAEQDQKRAPKINAAA